MLFDEDVPRKLVRSLPGHEIHTVVDMQWGGIKNGALLTLVERERFNVFLTGDKNMENQQRLEGRPFAVLILSAINWPVVRPHVHKISAALDDARPGTVHLIDCGTFVARPETHRVRSDASLETESNVGRAILPAAAILGGFFGQHRGLNPA